MFPTASRMAAGGPGFIKRSADEFSRLARIAWNLETLHVQSKPYHLLDFEKESTVQGCKTMADRAVGGYSTADLDYIPADSATGAPAHARFHGSISTKLPLNWRIQRTGYAAFRNHDRGMWLFGQLFWDMDPYAYLALRVKSDGRRYTVNVQTDSIVDSDIHQHRLFTRHDRIHQSSTSASQSSSSSTITPSDSPSETPAALADFPPKESTNTSPTSTSTSTSSYTTTPNPDSKGWETILIKWNDFVRTSYGTVVEPQTGMIKRRVKSIGIGLTDRVEGPYDLRIHRMWATNGLSEEELEEEKKLCGPDALEESAPVDGVERPSLVETEAKGLDRFKDLKGLKKDEK